MSLAKKGELKVEKPNLIDKTEGNKQEKPCFFFPFYLINLFHKKKNI